MHETPAAHFVEQPTINNVNAVAQIELFSSVDPEFSGVPGPVVNNQSAPGGEASLDIQWIGGVSRAATSYVYHGGYFSQHIVEYLIAQTELDSDDDDSSRAAQRLLSSGANRDVLAALLAMDIFAAILYGETTPDVLSMSIGYPDFASSADWHTHMENYFPALGAMGVSLIAATGDRGAHFPWSSTFGGSVYTTITPPVDCGATIVPAFPASSPYVTAVGATQFVRAVDQHSACPMRWPPSNSTDSGGPCIEEIVCSIATSAWITSAGGFAAGNRPRPAYQKTVVDAYVQQHQQALSGLGHQDRLRTATNRGFPDVAANGRFCEIVLSGTPQPVDGTSCAAPTFAGLVSLINNELVAAGKPKLGFLNPTLCMYATLLADRCAFSRAWGGLIDVRIWTVGTITTAPGSGALRPPKPAHGAHARPGPRCGAIVRIFRRDSREQPLCWTGVDTQHVLRHRL
jgi:subtilase family serine protease